MSKIQRIKSMIEGLGMLGAAALMAILSDEGYYLVALLFCITLLNNAVNTLIYYLSIARYSVGGKIHLYKAIILLDFGMFVFSLDDVPRTYVLIYLVLVNLIQGIICIMRALESKKNNGRWRLKLSEGVITVAIAVLCVIFNNSVNVMVYIYSFGLVCSGFVHIADAFRKTAIVYIQ